MVPVNFTGFINTYSVASQPTPTYCDDWGCHYGQPIGFSFNFTVAGILLLSILSLLLIKESTMNKILHKAFTNINLY